MSRPLLGARGLRKGKIVESLSDARGSGTLQRAPERSSIGKKSHGGSSMKDKAMKILADSEVGTSDNISPRIKRSFVERRYSPSIGKDRSEWEIILEQLLIIGLIEKEEVVSENDD
jgi:hypothetical protein